MEEETKQAIGTIKRLLKMVDKRLRRLEAIVKPDQKEEFDRLKEAMKKAGFVTEVRFEPYRRRVVNLQHPNEKEIVEYLV